MLKVDLNSDLGEAFGAYKMGHDSEILKYVSSANVACGFHAGDPCVMDETLDLAKKNNVKIGAHVGFPDLLGFGRRNMAVSPAEAKNYALYQIGALFAFARAKNMKISHFKAHGALYNMASVNENLAMALCEAVSEFDSNIIILGLSGSKMQSAARKMGLKYASEVFADRNYNNDGTLVSRTLPNALIHDENEVLNRVVQMIKHGKVKSIEGKEISIQAHSICTHGDNLKAIAFVKTLKEGLEKEGIEICALEDL